MVKTTQVLAIEIRIGQPKASYLGSELEGGRLWRCDRSDGTTIFLYLEGFTHLHLRYYITGSRAQFRHGDGLVLPSE